MTSLSRRKRNKMSEFAPVMTLADLQTLDNDDVVEGYKDGLDGDPEPREQPEPLVLARLAQRRY